MVEKKIEKTEGLAGLFSILKREFWGLLGLNLMFVIACLPVITFGSALGGMFRVTRLMVEDKPIGVWQEFKKGFKDNWKQSSVAGFIIALAGIGIYIGINQGIFASNKLMFLLSVTLLLFISLTYVFVFTIIVSVHLPMSAVLKNSLLLGISQLKYSMPSALFSVVALSLLAIFFPYSLPAFFLGVFSLLALVNTYASWQPINKYVIEQN